MSLRGGSNTFGRHYLNSDHLPCHHSTLVPQSEVWSGLAWVGWPLKLGGETVLNQGFASERVCNGSFVQLGVSLKPHVASTSRQQTIRLGCLLFPWRNRTIPGNADKPSIPGKVAGEKKDYWGKIFGRQSLLARVIFLNTWTSSCQRVCIRWRHWIDK